MSRLRSRQEAEDALQNAFVCALRALQRGVVPVNEVAWLLKIAENVCHASHRSSSRRQQGELMHNAELVEELPAQERDDDSLFGLADALTLIPERQRKAIVLREWYGLSYREIARELGLTVTAVETLIFRARRSLARALNGGAGLKQRSAGIFDLGWLSSALKSVLGGAGTAKLAAGVAVVAVAVLPVGDSSGASLARHASAPAASSSSGSSPAGTVEPTRTQGPAGSGATTAGRVGGRHRAGPAKRASEPGKATSERPSSGSTAPAGSAPGQSGPQPAPPAGTQTPLELPHVAVPPPPAELPVSVPSVPSLPVQVPSLPTVPTVTDLPVQPPDPGSVLPPLPKLP